MKSFKYMAHKERNKYLVADCINLDKNFNKFLKDSIKKNVFFSGYGLRKYELLEKHREKISDYVLRILSNDLKIENLNYFENDYLLVHIRRTDFLQVSSYEEINFTYEEWISSILFFSKQKKITNIVIFSDETLNNNFLRILKENSLKVFVPESFYKICFIKLFFNYVKNAKYIMCNFSSLSITFSFLIREYIYTPSKKEFYKKMEITKLFSHPFYSKFC